MKLHEVRSKRNKEASKLSAEVGAPQRCFTAFKQKSDPQVRRPQEPSNEEQTAFSLPW